MRQVVWAVVGAFAALGFAALLAVQWYVGAAYRFARDYPLTSVGSFDQLYKLGSAAPAFTAGGLLVVAVLAFVVTVVMLILPRTRTWAWLVPLGSVLLVAGVVLIGTSLFEAPAPDLGG